MCDSKIYYLSEIAQRDIEYISENELIRDEIKIELLDALYSMWTQSVFFREADSFLRVRMLNFLALKLSSDTDCWINWSKKWIEIISLEVRYKDGGGLRLSLYIAIFEILLEEEVYLDHLIYIKKCIYELENFWIIGFLSSRELVLIGEGEN